MVMFGKEAAAVVAASAAVVEASAADAIAAATAAATAASTAATDATAAAAAICAARTWRSDHFYVCGNFGLCHQQTVASSTCNRPLPCFTNAATSNHSQL